ncbi:YycH family regulatory protein [Desmospora activa]|uniref:Regulatory protein YycH of two-component signal transduction system YycFG n=1 Tax=Desmospora activa DSM 45169 TaxID=1121389 RepID=A0A2T4Z4Q3_9BACL|nr:two-component system activity regulator YycH [Desmospora activa]PTM56871.1 regulatory protein YycH of two-component signal transduction system YycFG [Desmospora activa DSM 45169]
MREHLKSIALFLLVIASCAQTGLLWYNSPSYEEPLRPDYIQPFKIGNEEFEKQNLFELTAPPEIVLHREGTHQQVFPENAKHQDLMEKLHFTQFEEFKPITPASNRWNELMEQEDGIELRMNRETNIEVLSTLFSTRPNAGNLETFSRIWFHGNGDNTAVSVWLISDQDQKVVEGTAQIEDFNDWISLADFENSPLVSPVYTDEKEQVNDDFRGVPRVFYLPDHDQQMDKKTFTLNTIDIDDMRKALFPDPSLAKRTLVRDSVYIYSDRRRTLQYNGTNETMVFSNPTNSTVQDSSSASEELNSINRFINRHGGWTSNYLLERVNEDSANETTLYDFRLFSGGYPVFWSKKDKEHLDTIRLAATNQGVATYERSLRYLVTNSEQTQPGELLSKQDLLKQLEKQKLPLSRIDWIYPGYRAEVQEEAVELKPVWVVIDNQGEMSFIP